MIWAIGIAILLVCLCLYVNFARKRRAALLLQELQEKWGKPKTDEYFNFSFIARYFESQEEKAEDFQVISEQTAKDLDFETLFKFLDRTTSRVGQQYLYKRLRVLESVEKQHFTVRLAKLFADEDLLRLGVQKQLHRLSSTDAYDLEFWTQEHLEQKQTNKKLLYTLSFSVVVFLVLGTFFPFCLIFLLPIFVVNMVFHYINKYKLVYYVNGITQLSVACGVCENLTKNELIAEQFDTSFLSEIAVIKKRITFLGADKRLDSEIGQLAWLLMEILKILFNFEVLVFFSLEKSLLQKQEAIVKLFNFIGEIDVAISVASVRAGEVFTCEPKFIQEKKIFTEELRHPLLTNSVSNDLTLVEKSFLLTGMNMLGKTTFIKTLGVNALLGQTLGFCFAKSYEAPFWRIYASVKITDDLLADTSYYLQEVLNVKSFIDVLQDDAFSLFILDELFKGTNTTERIAAGEAVLSFLNTEKSVVLVSTHDVELAELLKEKNYQLHCFDEQVANNEIHFSYKLKDGIPKHRNAIKILGLYDYPKKVVTEAERLADKLK